jgi:aminomethyltransferase
MTGTSLKRTPLYPLYTALGGKVIDFGGWELPVQFSSIMREHEAVRTRAGLFDVSHMGEVIVEGPQALAFLQRLTTNDVARLTIGQAQYSMMCYPSGGVVDDLLVYRLAEEQYMLVINAANIDKDLAWLLSEKTGNLSIRDISREICLLALQGPRACDILQKLSEKSLSELASFHFLQDLPLRSSASGMTGEAVKALVSRTGYTGEDGFELYVRNEDATVLWHMLLEAGESFEMLPVGLGARDTLRFEAKLPLYGQELAHDISPLEAGLGFFVKFDKDQFIGREALLRQKEEGIPRKLVGIEMIDRGIPRTGYPVYAGEARIGTVTTGTQSPTLKKNVGLALIDASFATLGTQLEVEIREKRLQATVIPAPFYKRGK